MKESAAAAHLSGSGSSDNSRWLRSSRLLRRGRLACPPSLSPSFHNTLIHTWHLESREQRPSLESVLRTRTFPSNDLLTV